MEPREQGDLVQARAMMGLFRVSWRHREDRVTARDATQTLPSSFHSTAPLPHLLLMLGQKPTAIGDLS